ncbi:MAG: secondary thiamine-phosphate synthase enzyme YjbQ [Planctomycetota bacterium]|nr:secondary thiamine-phosphate synthase enzyme YjbQ [Planctomycetota bacterium]
MAWFQKQLTLPAKPRGFHLVTETIVDACPEISRIKTGLCHLFILHTSASLTINENADAEVRVDFETAMNSVCPEHPDFVHTYEGPDDMPAHVKASLLGNSLSIPISAGRLVMGTWQGIYLCEHRNQATNRRIVATIQGE